MCKKEKMVKKLYQALNLMSCESKISRRYGTEHLLTCSDIDLLKCVQRNKDAKASILSRYMGVTNGAVTQLAKKLESKGYLAPYRIDGNKKEVYYKLTPCGEAACQGYDEHYAKTRLNMEAYIATLDDTTLDKITHLFDIISDSIVVEGRCSIKQDSHETGCAHETSEKRCEKCQKAY